MEMTLLIITGISLIVAAVTASIAWRVSREERARSAARVSTLVAATNGERGTGGGGRGIVGWEPSSEAASVPLSHAPFSSTVEPREGGGRQRVLAIAAGILLVVLVAAGSQMFATSQGNVNAGPGAAEREPGSGAAPLELLSLRHEREGQRLSVSGLVRNPDRGGRVDRLTAVVFLFDSSGSFVTSAKAPADFLRLSPGDETPFVVAVEAPASVARYRVSFRTDAGVVPHVDRRPPQ